MVERTLAVIRQEAVAKNQVGHIRRHLETAGFKIVVQQKIKPVGAEAEAFIASIQGEGGSALLLEMANAAIVWQSLIPIIQRKDAEHLPAGSLYGSSAENAVDEIGHIFPKYRPAPKVEAQEAQFSNSPLVTFGEPDDRTMQQIHTCMAVGNVVGGALCGDAHVGYAQPVGGVVAYEDMISISGVGFDIACGNMAVRTNIPFSAVKDRVPTLLRDISRRVSFGLGRINNKVQVEHPLFDDIELWRDAEVEHLRQLAESQILTCGSSNHYVDLMRDVSEEGNPDEQAVWIGVHFGSRGLGFKSTTHYLKLAGGKEGMFIAPTILRTTSELGQRYIKAMQLSGEYAYANRAAVIHEIRKILGAKELEVVHNHHNFAWEEEHNGRKLWVVRKGATPAFPGQRGFVGGSMGDDAVIIEGVDSERSRAAFYSTIHGAGRVMSRKQAHQSFTRHQMQEWLNGRGVTLLGGDVDESPMSYRRLDDVLKFHEGTIKVISRLRPFGVLMAGRDDRSRDPYHE